MTQLEFYKSFQFVLELLLAETMYVYRLRKRSLFPLRAALCAGACVLFAWLFPLLSDNAFYLSFMFLMIFAFTVLMGKIVFRETWLTVLFCCIAGYTTQHLTYELYNISLVLMDANAPMGLYGTEFVGIFSNPFLAAVYVCIYVLSYFLCFFFFGGKLKSRESVRLKTAFLFIFVIFILIVDIFLNAIVVYYMSANKVTMIIVGIYNILCCLIALYLQFEVALKRKLEATLETVQQIWHQVKEQYAVSKETVELINMKCHDLKHQIHVLNGSRTVSDRTLRDLENSISVYDSVVKTGNDALDVILTEKSLLCNKNGIRLSCIADGEKLGFMSEENIYALFGNIVDNAIEAALKLDAARRVISLHVRSSGDMLVIRESNYYDEDIRFENGLPQTTKKDRQYHGFGIRSIQYICDLYGGDLSITAENNVFAVNILFFPKDRGES